MKLPEALDFKQDAREHEFAVDVLVPALLGIVGATLGIGAAKACCGVKYRKLDPHNLLPISMAVVTSGIAMWSYLNPPPTDPSLWSNNAKKAKKAVGL